jgi:hypothetical protein
VRLTGRDEVVGALRETLGSAGIPLHIRSEELYGAKRSDPVIGRMS